MKITVTPWKYALLLFLILVISCAPNTILVQKNLKRLPNKIKCTLFNIDTLHSLGNFIFWKYLILPWNRIIFFFSKFSKLKIKTTFLKSIIPWVKLPLTWIGIAVVRIISNSIVFIRERKRQIKRRIKAFLTSMWLLKKELDSRIEVS